MVHFGTLFFTPKPAIFSYRSAPSSAALLHSSLGPIILAIFCASMTLGMAQTVRADDVEEAYALNQEAMVDMSMAEFESAARKFLKAAALVPDYGVKDRNLRYTPVFMAAW